MYSWAFGDSLAVRPKAQMCSDPFKYVLIVESKDVVTERQKRWWSSLNEIKGFGGQ
jgi:hypothetical protein